MKQIKLKANTNPKSKKALTEKFLVDLLKQSFSESEIRMTGKIEESEKRMTGKIEESEKRIKTELRGEIRESEERTKTELIGKIKESEERTKTELRLEIAESEKRMTGKIDESEKRIKTDLRGEIRESEERTKTELKKAIYESEKVARAGIVAVLTDFEKGINQEMAIQIAKVENRIKDNINSEVRKLTEQIKTLDAREEEHFRKLMEKINWLIEAHKDIVQEQKLHSRILLRHDEQLENYLQRLKLLEVRVAQPV